VSTPGRRPAGLEVDKLTVAYGDRRVLENVSLTIAPGEFVGLVGPNASGKSTLLRAATRVLRPVSGRVLLDGRDVWREMSLGEMARSVAVVPQDFPVDFPFTVRETVLMGRTPFVGRLRGEQPADLARVRQAMESTETLALSDRLIGELAGGERQRVVLAKALAQDPRLLLLDEPTSHLDLSHQVDILDLLLGLNRGGGLTVVIVLHDLNLAAMYCDRLFLLGGGRLAAEGSPTDVLTPANLRVVYGSRVLVGRHPVYGCPQVTLVSRRLPAGAAETPDVGGRGKAAPARIHVVAGGGSSVGLLECLAAAGHRLTVGPVNAGDSDWHTARTLGVETVTVPPFSAVDREAVAKAAAAMGSSDGVLVGPVPFGRGNVAVLEAVLEAARAGRKVALVDGGPEEVASRDFAEGRASALTAELLAAGAVTLSGEREVLAWAGRMGEKR
jgi:iron complex transport system ATP-binding protein